MFDGAVKDCYLICPLDRMYRTSRFYSPFLLPSFCFVNAGNGDASVIGGTGEGEREREMERDPVACFGAQGQVVTVNDLEMGVAVVNMMFLDCFFFCFCFFAKG